MLINMDPEVAAAFPASTAVSRTYYFLISLILLFMIVVKGCGVDMLKMGNARRRSKKEIMDQKMKELQDKADIQSKLARVEALEAQIAEVEDLRRDNNAAHQMVEQLQAAGLISIDANDTITILHEQQPAHQNN